MNQKIFREIPIGNYVLRFWPSDNGWMCGITNSMMDALEEQPEPQEQHQEWCESLTRMLTSMPPKPAPCNCKHPEQRKPLTDDAVFDLIQQDYRMEEYSDAAFKLVRRTEAAHGIKEKNA